MFVVDKVVEEDRRLLHANELESITLPDGTTQTLGPATSDTFAIFEDLCLLGNGERPQFLELDYLHKTFALELIESVLTNYHDLFRKARVILLSSFFCKYQSNLTCSIPNYCSSCGTTSPRFSLKRCRSALVFHSRFVALASSFSFSNNFPPNSRQNLKYSLCF